jgi:hypothetical protein
LHTPRMLLGSYTYNVLRKERTMSDLNDRIQEILGDKAIGFDVNDWGSCQYSGALDIFNALAMLESQHGRMGALEHLGIKIKGHLTVNSLKRVSEIFIAEVLEQQDEWVNEDLAAAEGWKKYLTDGTYPWKSPVEWFDKRTPEERVEYAQKSIDSAAKDKIDWENEKANGFKSIDDIFVWTRNHSWDLWAAAPCIGPMVFPELEFVEEVEKAKGIGPIGNVMVQGLNNETGFWCWWLKSTGHVTDDSCFADFDT